MYIQKSKHFIIWNGGSTYYESISHSESNNIKLVLLAYAFFWKLMIKVEIFDLGQN